MLGVFSHLVETFDHKVLFVNIGGRDQRSSIENSEDLSELLAVFVQFFFVILTQISDLG